MKRNIEAIGCGLACVLYKGTNEKMKKKKDKKHDDAREHCNE